MYMLAGEQSLILFCCCCLFCFYGMPLYLKASHKNKTNKNILSDVYFISWSCVFFMWSFDVFFRWLFSYQKKPRRPPYYRTRGLATGKWRMMTIVWQVLPYERWMNIVSGQITISWKIHPSACWWKNFSPSPFKRNFSFTRDLKGINELAKGNISIKMLLFPMV